MSTRGAEKSEKTQPDQITLQSHLNAHEWQVSRPQFVPRAEYEHAINAFVEAVTAHPSVLSVYGDTADSVDPGASDLDFTVVVSDEPERIDELDAAVRRVRTRHPRVISHWPTVLSESSAPNYPLFDTFTRGFDHLAGKPIERTVSEDRHVATLLLFDELVVDPFCGVLSAMSPTVSHQLDNVPAARHLLHFFDPIVTAQGRRSERIERTLCLNKTTGMRVLNNTVHNLSRFRRALGREPETDTSCVDRALDVRRSYPETVPSTETYSSLLVELLGFNDALIREFVATQPVYDPADETFHLRRTEPTLATPAYDDLSIHALALANLHSVSCPRVLPTEVARHAATLPFASGLFYGSPPDPAVRRPDMAALIDHRNEIVADLITYKRRYGFESFHLPRIAAAHHKNNWFVPPNRNDRTRRLVSRFEDVRNRLVLNRWEKNVRNGFR